MAQTTSKNSSGTARDCHENQNEIFSQEIREFVNESRKSQTVYANFEGYHQRTVEYNDLTKLDDLVFLTLSDGKDRASLTPDQFAETDKLAKLMAKKIYNSCIKFNCNEVCFQVVWIYYFDYLKKDMKAMPVFKVYHKIWGSAALFIDITATEYESWDHFIMFGQFPASFICVPRRGEYTFRGTDGDDLLDLEYICKNSQLRRVLVKNFRPVSQILIQKFLDGAVDFGRTVIPFLNLAIKIADISGMNMHPVVRSIAVFVSVMSICLRLLELKCERNESRRALESTAADYSLMLLNDTGKKPSPRVKCLDLKFDTVERPLTDKTWIDLMNWIKNPKKNFMDILKFFPLVVDVCKLLFSSRKVGGVEGGALTFFSEFISVIVKETTENNKTKEIRSGETEKSLSNLEKYSCEKVFSKLEPSPGPITGKENFKPSLDVVGAQEFWLDLFGFRVYLLLKHTSVDCGRFLQRLLKPNYSLQGDTSFQDIILDGNVIGVFIPFSFQSQNHAIIVLRPNKLPEVNNRRTEVLSLNVTDSHNEK